MKMNTYSRDAPIVSPCPAQHRVAFTFDDGPHPIYTPRIVQTLARQQIQAGFFLLGTSIQSFLSAHQNLTVHQWERPRLGFLLLQDYSLVENLLRGHAIYLHGWLHEKNSEMRLQTVVDNIATQLLEIGLLTGFQPVYRAPWGVGSSPGPVNNTALLARILAEMGILPTLWNIDTKDYLTEVNENHLISSTLKLICKTRGGHLLMHDNRPSTAHLLDRLIRSIRASGHRIVTPADIDHRWNDPIRVNRTRRYTELLRQRARKIQKTLAARPQLARTFRPVEISLATKEQILTNIDPLASYKGTLRVSPSINDV